eukprot:GHVU01229922.1.p1 GENE.GHVU01229922.1~~GHVU01229922.1.p1  ORF type:complete len:173 (+),score=4.93 GHVU01229922.1:286-804(+)
MCSTPTSCLLSAIAAESPTAVPHYSTYLGAHFHAQLFQWWPMPPPPHAERMTTMEMGCHPQSRVHHRYRQEQEHEEGARSSMPYGCPNLSALACSMTWRPPSFPPPAYIPACLSPDVAACLPAVVHARPPTWLPLSASAFDVPVPARVWLHDSANPIEGCELDACASRKCLL